MCSGSLAQYSILLFTLSTPRGPLGSHHTISTSLSGLTRHTAPGSDITLDRNARRLMCSSHVPLHHQQHLFTSSKCFMNILFNVRTNLTVSIIIYLTNSPIVRCSHHCFHFPDIETFAHIPKLPSERFLKGNDTSLQFPETEGLSFPS